MLKRSVNYRFGMDPLPAVDIPPVHFLSRICCDVVCALEYRLGLVGKVAEGLFN